jgi:hypothetical protein
VALGLVTDTRPTERIEELVRGVDLLVSEAMYGDAGSAGARGGTKAHDLRRGGRTRPTGRVKQLVLSDSVRR